MGPEWLACPLPQDHVDLYKTPSFTINVCSSPFPCLCSRASSFHPSFFTSSDCLSWLSCLFPTNQFWLWLGVNTTSTNPSSLGRKITYQYQTLTCSSYFTLSGCALALQLMNLKGRYQQAQPGRLKSILPCPGSCTVGFRLVASLLSLGPQYRAKEGSREFIADRLQW
jgi:hypothetical protein